MQTPITSRRRGFTMMEIMVVVAILAILVALSVVIGGAVRNNALEGQTKATLGVLQGAMSEFVKNNPEPSGNPGDWLVKLTLDPAMAKNITNQKWYVPGNPPKALDAWGNQIIYLPSKNGGATPVAPAGWNQGQKETGTFWSWGRDGQLGGSDDLFSQGVAP